LKRLTDTSRAGRRQARKLLGRAHGCEWRVLGRQDRGIPPDALSAKIVAAYAAKEHLAHKMAKVRP